jgi:hypothetical protein
MVSVTGRLRMATAKKAEKKLDMDAFLPMVKKAKNYADLEKLVEKAGFPITGIKLRLASARNMGLVIPQLEGEIRPKPQKKDRKEVAVELATKYGFKFDAKQFKERKAREARQTVGA